MDPSNPDMASFDMTGWTLVLPVVLGLCEKYDNWTISNVL